MTRTYGPDGWLSEVIVCMRANLFRPLTVADIARHAEYSPSRLAHLFSKSTGRTVKETLTNLRMERAAELLERTNQRVKEVAAQVGMSRADGGSGGFGRAFKTWSGGLTPGGYRGTKPRQHTARNARRDTDNLSLAGCGKTKFDGNSRLLISLFAAV